MAKCWRCGKRGLFIRLTQEGLCSSCNAEMVKRGLAADIASSSKLTIQHSFSVVEVEVKQKTKGMLQPFSLDAWAGFVSPSGGFINYARYQVVGINPKTGRKNKRIYEEMKEEYAIKRAEIDGFAAPFEVNLLPSREPSERQLAYAKDLCIAIPEGACFEDVSALISRVTDEDEQPADENLASQAHIYGVKFSRYHGRKAILSKARELPSEDYRDFCQSI